MIEVLRKVQSTIAWVTANAVNYDLQIIAGYNDNHIFTIGVIVEITLPDNLDTLPEVSEKDNNND